MRERVERVREFDRLCKVPSSLAMDNLSDWIVRFSPDNPARRTLIDMSELGNAPPLGMLMLASAVRRYRRAMLAKYPYDPKSESTDPKVRIIAAQQMPSLIIKPNYSNGYLAHMGFWKSIGVDVGKAPGEAGGSSRYVPMTNMTVESLRSQAAARGREVGDILYQEADRLSEILSQDAGSAVEVTLAYTMRELFRNVVEHSKSNTIWHSAQYWPSKDKVEVAVLDEGQGVFASLLNNPSNVVKSEVQAIIKSTNKGVTGAQPRPALRTVSGELAESRWVNSGWGLFVLKKLAEAAGSLLIVSNVEAVTFSKTGLRSFRFDHKGTAVRITLRPSLLKNLLVDILRSSTEGSCPEELTPSMLARLENSHF